MLNAPPPKAGANMGATFRQQRCFGQFVALGFDKFVVTQSLFQAPPRYGVVKDFVEIALRFGAESKFSHIVTFCAP